MILGCDMLTEPTSQRIIEEGTWCASFFSTSLIKYPDKSNLRGKDLFDLLFPRGNGPSWCDRHPDMHTRPVCHSVLQKQREMAVGPGYETSETTLSDILLPARLRPTGSITFQKTFTSWGQVFKHMHLWGMFPIQTTESMLTSCFHMRTHTHYLNLVRIQQMFTVSHKHLSH